MLDWIGGVVAFLNEILGFGARADKRRDRLVDKQAGRAESENEHLKETADARDAMDAIPEPDRESTAKRLRDGDF